MTHKGTIPNLQRLCDWVQIDKLDAVGGRHRNGSSEGGALGDLEFLDAQLVERLMRHRVRRVSWVEDHRPS